MILIGILFISNTLFAILLIKDASPDFELQRISEEMRVDAMKELPDTAVCRHYTKYYKERMAEIGIETQSVRFQTSTEETENKTIINGHVFLIAYSEEGYCKLDQRIINCFKFYGKEKVKK